MATDEDIARALQEEFKRPGTKLVESEDAVESLLDVWRFRNFKRIMSDEERIRLMQTPEGLANVLANELWVPKRDAVGNVIPIQYPQFVSLLAQDDVIDMALRFCEKFFELKDIGLGKVTIGYHWTDKSRIETIKTQGLLTPKEQAEINGNDSPVAHGSVFGSGVYVGENPYTFSYYGEECLCCLVLRGKTCTHITEDEDVHCYIGNKTGRRDSDEIVLRKSCQVFPIFRFSPEEKRSGDEGNVASVEYMIRRMNDLIELINMTL